MKMLLRLPTILLQKIISYLHCYDLVKLSSVSKTARKRIGSLSYGVGSWEKLQLHLLREKGEFNSKIDGKISLRSNEISEFFLDMIGWRIHSLHIEDTPNKELDIFSHINLQNVNHLSIGTPLIDFSELPLIFCKQLRSVEICTGLYTAKELLDLIFRCGPSGLCEFVFNECADVCKVVGHLLIYAPYLKTFRINMWSGRKIDLCLLGFIYNISKRFTTSERFTFLIDYAYIEGLVIVEYGRSGIVVQIRDWVQLSRIFTKLIPFSGFIESDENGVYEFKNCFQPTEELFSDG